jgi:hypothetical protein
MFCSGEGMWVDEGINEDLKLGSLQRLTVGALLGNCGW